MTPFERLDALLRRVTYKPGWSLSLSRLRRPDWSPQPWDPLYLTISFTTTDVTTGLPVTISNMGDVYPEFISRLTDGEIVDTVLTSAIRNMEEHELREWLKLDGICVRDPHPERTK